LTEGRKQEKKRKTKDEIVEWKKEPRKRLKRKRSNSFFFSYHLKCAKALFASAIL